LDNFNFLSYLKQHLDAQPQNTNYHPFARRKEVCCVLRAVYCLLSAV
jgi:hypothetical protein